jgi:hypothetical protein
MDSDLNFPKHKRFREKDTDRNSKKRHKRDGHESSRKNKRKDNERNKLHITDDDPYDEDMWVEKNIDMDGERVSALSILRLDAMLTWSM